MSATNLADLTDRAREIFRVLVDSYLEGGAPVGSRTLARRLDQQLSAATVRNVMQDLEELGLLSSPHASAGRLPSELGLRLFVDSLLEVTDFSSEDSPEIMAALKEEEGSSQQVLVEAGKMLSGLSRGASLVLAPRADKAVDHIHFLQVSDGSMLASLVMKDGDVENRLFSAPPGITRSVAQEAANFLNARMRGRTLADARREIATEMEADRREIDSAAERLVDAGLASLEGADAVPNRLIVRGLSNLLDDAREGEGLDRIKRLMDDLERRKTVAQLLDLVREAEGVRVFIGSENPMFSLAGSSLVISPYMDGRRKVIGALAVIGPTRLNYGRVVPAVDFTARFVGRLLEHRAREGIEELVSGEER